MDNTNIPLWGVQGLSDEEQRQVRGGAQVSPRASCIRSAVQNYVNTVRNNPNARSSARQIMMNNIMNCNSGSSV